MSANVNDLRIDTCDGVFNYLPAATDSSLLRNGQVMIRRDPDGNTAHSEGFDLEAHAMPVRNARTLSEDASPTCYKNGFELLVRPLAKEKIDFTDHARIVDDYYLQCAAIVAQSTGAEVYAFDHNVRSASGKQNKQRLTGGQDVQGPAHILHGDYTLRSAPERLQQLAEVPAGNDTLSGMLATGKTLISQNDVMQATADSGRFAIINVWRNIDHLPVAIHPLALCNSQSVMPEDLVVFEIHYPNRIGENYFAKHTKHHEMYYYPAMTRDEILLIKQWDSAGPLARSNGRKGDASDAEAPCTFSLHSAFVDPQAPVDAPDRRSIEVRCLVIYD